MRRRPLTIGAGVTLAGLGAVTVGMLGLAPTPLAAVALGAGLTLVGLVLLVPALVAPTARCVGNPLARLFGEPAVLGRENALRSPQRTAATATALMIGIGLIGVVAVLAASMKTSADSTIEKAMRADFVVSTYQVPGAATGVPPVAADKLRQSPAIAAVSEIRSGQWGLDGTGVLVRDSVARRHGWRIGDVVPMTFARTGTVPLRLAATYTTTTVRSDYVVALETYVANYAQQLDRRPPRRRHVGGGRPPGHP